MISSGGSIPDPGSRYVLGEILGKGVFGKVYNAFDTQASNKKVAIKIQKFDGENTPFIEEEYGVLKELSGCIYVVSFYGIFRTENSIWFVLENCEGNTALDLVIGLKHKNRRISEEHIAYILKELVKALIYLHEHNIIHRDIKASNVLLTKDGEIKLCDFGLAKKVKNKESKLCECIGSPCWMAPEVVIASGKHEKAFYDNRVDVWGLGITAIELAEGKAPFQSMPSSKVLFQIVKNPPPILEKVSSWTEQFHDFISECLVKYYEHRPYIMEIIEHPFLQDIPENNYHLSLELKTLIGDVGKGHVENRPAELVVIGKYLKSSKDDRTDVIIQEDLADLDKITEKNTLNLLEERFKRKQFYTFVGDILMSVNPNEKLDIYGPKFHQQYFQKSRSENAPHIYAVADIAYQNALHHIIPQQIVLTGESASGKTTNYLQIIDYLFSTYEQHPVSIFRIKNGIKLIHALTHAGTPTNHYSTRCVLKTNISFGQTGKLTGAYFKIWCLEKWRISSVDLNQCNFHILYYILDGLIHTDATQKYRLQSRRNYRYLRLQTENAEYRCQPRDNIDQNIIKYKKIFSYLEEFEFSEEQISTFFSIVAAVLNLGEIRFTADEEDGLATIANKEYVDNFADLMEIDEKKFTWSLTNYCLARKGNVIKKKNTCDEARNSRDVLANNLYCRFVDYVVGMINHRLEIGKAIFGNKYSINLLDFFGFECFKQNHLPEFFVNCFNEQIQYHYLQRIFSWEVQELRSEGLNFEPISYYDNKRTLNQLLSKPEGVLSIVDDAAKRSLNGKYVIDNLQNQNASRITISKNTEFAVTHFTGKVSYNVKEMPDKNRDFLPAEIIETLKESENPIIRTLFANNLDKTGSLILNFNRTRRNRTGLISRQSDSTNQFSQIKHLRTAGTVYRSVCLELIKELSVGGSSGGTHFVRCIRSDLKNRPQYFNVELVKQQIRALSVVETVKIRQKGYPHRISFAEFLRRYQFLAFDFNENVEITKDNCRLLLIRLKMEGWAIGKTKVFLKYYNEEFLARLYETQVRKIIKIQSIMRGFLAKCKINNKLKEQGKECIEEIQKRRRSSVMTEEEAAEIIQKAYRKSAIKRKSISEAYQPLDDREKKLILPYAKRWKTNSIFYVLLKYRAAKMNDFFNFSQQVHFYNQNTFYQIQNIEEEVDLDKIDKTATVNSWLGAIKPAVLKIKFRLDEIPFFDTSALCEQTNVSHEPIEEHWDSPYQWRQKCQTDSTIIAENSDNSTDLIAIPYNRDPEEVLTTLTSKESEHLSYGSDRENIIQENRFRQNEKNATNHQMEYNGKGSFREKQEKFASTELRNTDNRYRFNQPESSFNSAPANNDFKFIKPNISTPKLKNVDHIAELRNISKRRDAEDDDEPPFNFQGMLRKTNYQRDSIKRTSDRRDSVKSAALEAVRRFSLPKNKLDNAEKDKANRNVTLVNSRPVYMELVPGLILEGVEVDL